MTKKDEKKPTTLTVKYDLKYPFTGTGREIKSFDLKRFTLADIEEGNAIEEDFARGKFLIQRSTGLADDEMGKLNWHDYQEIDKVCRDFL
jgi:hypothetical protein